MSLKVSFLPKHITESELKKAVESIDEEASVSALHPREQWNCSPPCGANDISQYGGIANRHIALAGAMSDVKSNLNVSRFVADGGQVEYFVVVSTCGEHRAIAQFRCLELTGMDIHIYIFLCKRGTTKHHNYLPRLSARQLTHHHHHHHHHHNTIFKTHGGCSYKWKLSFSCTVLL